jgi:hypothetical protein
MGFLGAFPRGVGASVAPGWAGGKGGGAGAGCVPSINPDGRRNDLQHDKGAQVPAATYPEIVAAVLAIAKQNNAKPSAVMRKQIIDKLALMQPPRTIEDNTKGPDGKELSALQLVGAAKDEATKTMAAELAPQVTKTLDSPLVELFVKNSRSWPPMMRWDIKLKDKIDDATAGARSFIQEQTLQKLITVLCQTEVQGLLDTTLARGITVKAFLKSGQDGQMTTINALWNECTTAGKYNKQQADMLDNTNPANAGSEQLPSSIHPVRVANGAVKTFQVGRAGTAFKTLGVGFRVEGSDDARGKGVDWHVNRVVTGGMWPQVTNDTLMMGNGYNVSGTVVAQGSALAPRLNVTQKDLWNESGICVSRSFFGATAFPYRETKGKVILWALNVGGLIGFDTEKYQDKHKTANGSWRPGEKCFPRIDEKRILGWVLVTKLGNGNDGWEFSVPQDAKWGTTGGTPSKEQKQYIDEELAAWAGTTVSVPTAYDFAGTKIKYSY